MDFDPKDLSPEDRLSLLRWRLALGEQAEQVASGCSLAGLAGAAGDAIGVGAERLSDFDRAMGVVYGDDRRGGSGPSRPHIPTWLANLREFFSQEVVALVQKDAIERKDMKALLFEPETLALLDRNVELVATLVSARGMVPSKAKDIARQIVREVVEELRRKLESEIRTAVFGALRRGTQSPLPIMRNLDWKRTITRNLKGWDRERKRLLPERFYFWANQRRRHEWDVALLVDQSGSMGESVVYSSVMAAIFASLDVLRTRLLLFDTQVVDMTPALDDPVEVLFSAQLGGGTDINRAVAYAQGNFIERPDKTLLILITDLYEGGNAKELVARMRQLVESRVKVVVLLALSDRGHPSYDHDMAKRLTALGIPCFGCTPKKLVAVMEQVLKGGDLRAFLDRSEPSRR
ncbi:VWA domain-containing protein [Paraliomyxa miuraensis]|uniref:VWA domain-containing protein n=1 Tax=Paraliomyxa miuraensis TaxID=376150 RepID=UPI0022538DD8|nr:VWA domain-containing protein [Paraliomyxa miuraensis]MCX4246533.1 VWA domain-containing protein [Paraliomyxa miuraensis]